jgi:hypothetical protein
MDVLMSSRVTGSWVIRWRKEIGPDEYVRHVNGRDVWLDAPESAAVFPTKAAAVAAMRDVRDRSRFYVMRSIGHEAQKQAEAQKAEETEAERAYRRTWGPR